MFAMIVILGFIGLMIYLNKKGIIQPSDKKWEEMHEENSRILTDPGYRSLGANIYHED